jgi:hypothetical protein
MQMTNFTHFAMQKLPKEALRLQAVLMANQTIHKKK